MGMDAINVAARNIWDQTKQGVGALAESFGLPSSTSEIKPYLQRSVQAAQHPVQAIAAAGKATAQALGHPSDENLLTKAKSAWDSGDKVTAARHVASYLIPFVGAGVDKSADELVNGEYGKSFGHFVSAALPLILGANAPESVPMSEADAAQVASKAATVTARPEAGISSPRNAIKAQFVKGSGMNPAEEVKPVVPITEAERPAAANVADTDADAGIREFLGKIQSTASPEHQKSLVGSAPVKPSLRQLLSSERGELTIPGTAPDVPTFYSKAEQVANEKVPSNASGDQILATLRNNGVKENEIGWMGLDDFLKGKPKVSKADLQQFIKENQIQLEESTRGTNPNLERIKELQSQRAKVKAQNDQIYQLQLRFLPPGQSTALMEAMRSGDEGAVQSAINAMPEGNRAGAQRFVNTDRQLRELDQQTDALGGSNPEMWNKQPKFEQYTLPGEKSNYKEMLLKIPQAPRKVMDTIAKEMGFGGWTYQLTPEQQAAVTRAFEQQPSESKPFQSAHFDEPNILAHVRFDDRPSVDGKKTLFLEEVQSDWHQQGKQKGYITAPPTQQDIDLKFVPSKVPAGHDPANYPGYWESFDKRDGQMITRHPGTMNQAQAMKDALAFGKIRSEQGVPEAPFKSDWHELVMKRMLRHAAENGYDRIAWTTGDQQAARYDLSKQVQSVEYYPDTKTLEAYDHSGKRVISQTDVERKDLPDYIGKEAAAKLSAKIDEYPQFSDKDYPVDFDDEIGKFVAHDPNGDLVRDSGGDVIASSSQTEVEKEIQYMLEHERNQVPTPRVSGLDLKVGGEWAKALYDRAIPNFLKTYAKKWGAKVGTSQLKDAVGVNERYDLTETPGGWRLVDKQQNQGNGTFLGPVFKNGGAAEKWLKNQGYLNQTVHSLDITPAMKKDVMKKGQPIARANTPRPDWTAAVNV